MLKNPYDITDGGYSDFKSLYLSAGVRVTIFWPESIAVETCQVSLFFFKPNPHFLFFLFSFPIYCLSYIIIVLGA